MQLVRYVDRADESISVGVQVGDVITQVAGTSGIGELLALSLGEIRAAVSAADGRTQTIADVLLLPPVDGRMEVWAAGVTYRRSKQARVEESREPTVYELVYDADRPELFFKSSPWRVVTDGEPIAIRADSDIDVPEPELALVVNAHQEIVGFSVCNDVSSRTIEGANPLYLPQAKIFAGCCALSPGIRPAWNVPDPYALDITVTVTRAGAIEWSERTTTARLHRRFEQLVEHLFREEHFPHGVVLATGTGIVPDMTFALQAGDVVAIEVGDVGTLANTVVEGKSAMAWLLDASERPLTRAKVRP